jgi:hypothetical protein
MQSRVIIVGEYGPADGDISGAEVWGANLAYRKQVGITHIFAMDHLVRMERKHSGFVEDVNDLNVPVVMQRHYEEIPLSVGFPLQPVIERFFGNDKNRAYLTSTICYMMAMAILNKFDRIELHHILTDQHSNEYFAQKSGLDFFYAWALASGIEIALTEDCLIGRPYPWQPPLYGYHPRSKGAYPDYVLATAVGAITFMPDIREQAEILTMEQEDG